MKPETPKLFTLAASAMLICSTYIFSVLIGLPYLFMICSAILSISIFLPFRVKYNDRSVIYSIVISLSMAIILDLLFPMDRDKFMLIGEILFINISAPFLIYFCAFITFFEFNVHMPGLVSAISIVIFLLSADIQRGGDSANKIPFFAFSSRTQDKLFMLGMIIQLILLIPVCSYGKPFPIKIFRNKAVFAKFAMMIIAITFSFALLFSSFKLYNVFEFHIRRLEGLFMRYSLKTVRTGTAYMSSRVIDLRKPMSEQFRDAKEQIILRASSSEAPGYLRGRVYDNYVSGSWLPVMLETRKLNSKSYEGILVYKTFFLGERAMQYPQKIEFIYSGNFKTDVLLVPGNYEQIELVAERLAWNQNGSLFPEEWEKDGGYTVFLKSLKQNSAYNPPSDGIADISGHMIVPENILPLIDYAIKEIFGEKNIFTLSDAEKIEEIQKYFLSNFKYSLDFSMDYQDNDPLETFFRRKKGHCELFASSAVLIARRLGIPARYITGFLCFEKHPIGAYYVSRLDNAHAWAEVYVNNKWILLETTPEDGIPRTASNERWNFFKSYSDYFYRLMQSMLADVRRGFFAKAVLAIVIASYEVLKDLVWHPLRGPLFLIAIFFVFLLKRIIARRKRRALWKLSEETLMLADEFAKFERLIASKTQIKRESSETISEWVSRIALRFSTISENLFSFSEIYQMYRFGNGGTPKLRDIEKIRKMRKLFPWKKIKNTKKEELT